MSLTPFEPKKHASPLEIAKHVAETAHDYKPLTYEKLGPILQAYAHARVKGIRERDASLGQLLGEWVFRMTRKVGANEVDLNLLRKSLAELKASAPDTNLVPLEAAIRRYELAPFPHADHAAALKTQQLDAQARLHEESA